MPTKRYVYPHAVRYFYFTARTTAYICSQVGLKFYDLQCAIEGTNYVPPSTRRNNPVKLDKLCREKAGRSLYDLLREAEDVYRAKEIAEILNLRQNTVGMRARQMRIKSLPGFYYLFWHWWDIYAFMGRKDVAKHHSKHPLWLWRKQLKLTHHQAAKSFKVKPEVYIAWETGRFPSDINKIVTVLGEECVKKWARWQVQLKAL